MSECEYRLGSKLKVPKKKDDPENEYKNLRKLKIAGVALAGGSGMICRVRANRGEIYPVCELPNHGSKDGPNKCPIADYAQGRLTIEQANERLTKIFESEKK